MSHANPGLPRLATEFWGVYAAVFIGYALLATFAGSVVLVGILFLQPSLIPYLVLAALGFGVYLAGVTARDVVTGEFDPRQTEWRSPFDPVLIGLAVLAYVTALFWGSVVGAWFLLSVEVHWAVPVLFALYYPVIDIWIIRRVEHSPGGIVLRATLVLLGLVTARRSASIADIPVVGRGRRPQY